MLTNFETVRKSVARYDKIEAMKEDGTFDKLSKKEASQLNKELLKLKKNLDGVRTMTRFPGALFVIDPGRENIAVREAAKLNIPIVALIDTNCDPSLVTHIIPGNDDAIRSIKLITSIVLDFVMKGKNEYNAGKKAAETSKDKEEAGAKPKGEEDELVESAEDIATRFRRGKKEEKIEEEKTIKHRTGTKKPTGRRRE